MATSGFWIFWRHLWILIEIKHLFPVNAKITPIAYVVRLIFVTELPASLLNMNISDVGLFKGKFRSQTFSEVPTDCYCTSANTTWRTASLIQDHAEPMTTFFYLMPLLRRFRIKRCKRQAALHSALFNYTPLVIGGTDKNKQLTNFKPTETGINRNKYTFAVLNHWSP
jgi:hypothetical protein